MAMTGNTGLAATMRSESRPAWRRDPNWPAAVEPLPQARAEGHTLAVECTPAMDKAPERQASLAAVQA
jgi:hypothetical protein